MKRTTFFADEQLMDELKEIAREERKTLASVVREATALYVRAKRKKKKRKLSIVGIGSSGRTDVAERHEELLWKRDKP
jgi:metal-responsive CopG/Arc/MetJ family transcriptional regulator